MALDELRLHSGDNVAAAFFRIHTENHAYPEEGTLQTGLYTQTHKLAWPNSFS